LVGAVTDGNTRGKENERVKANNEKMSKAKNSVRYDTLVVECVLWGKVIFEDYSYSLAVMPDRWCVGCV
jgi:hypothetical protein